MKHCECPKCGRICMSWGMSGNPDSQNYFLCDKCRIAWYWINPKRVMFTDDTVERDDLLYVHVKNPQGGFELSNLGQFGEKVQFT